MLERDEQADEPAWVIRMRADGFQVRRGTDPRPLSVEPEVDFSPPRRPRQGLRRHVIMIARKLWNRTQPTRRLAHPDPNATVP